MTADSKKLSIPLGAWTPADEAEAMKEGWLLAAFEPDNELKVVKFDESNIFETDKEASEYVRLIASSLHNRARAAMGHPQVQITNANDALDNLITKAMPASKDITIEDQANIKALIIAMQSDQYSELLNPSFTSLPELVYTFNYYIAGDPSFRTMDTYSACVQSLEELAWSIYNLNNDLDKLSFVNVHQQSKLKDFEEALSKFLHIILVLGVLSNTNPLMRMFKNASDRTLQWVEDQNAIHNTQSDQQHTPKPTISKPA